MRTIESTLLTTLTKGDHFYTDKDDRHITALANHYKIKSITERLIATTTRKAEPVAKYICKVTLL